MSCQHEDVITNAAPRHLAKNMVIGQAFYASSSSKNSVFPVPRMNPSRRKGNRTCSFAIGLRQSGEMLTGDQPGVTKKEQTASHVNDNAHPRAKNFSKSGFFPLSFQRDRQERLFNRLRSGQTSRLKRRSGPQISGPALLYRGQALSPKAERGGEQKALRGHGGRTEGFCKSVSILLEPADCGAWPVRR